MCIPCALLCKYLCVHKLICAYQSVCEFMQVCVRHAQLFMLELIYNWFDSILYFVHGFLLALFFFEFGVYVLCNFVVIAIFLIYFLNQNTMSMKKKIKKISVALAWRIFEGTSPRRLG